MSAAKCSKCKGLLPAWLTAAGGAKECKCPNCGHVNNLVAMRTPAPQPLAGTPAPQPLKSTNTYSTLENGASKSPSLNKTMFMGSGTAKAPDLDSKKAAGLAKTMMMPQAAPPAPVPEAKDRKRTPTLPGSAQPQIPEFPATTPLPVPAPPAAVIEAAAASAAPASVESIDSGETDADIDVEIDTPPPAPPSKTSLPSWVVTEPLGDGESQAVMAHDRMAFLRSRPTLIGAGAVGLVGLVLAVVLMTRGSKPQGPVSVEVKRPVEKLQPPPAPEPEAEPVRPAPQPEVARKAPEPAPRPVVARKAPEPAAKPEPAPKAEPAPRPVAAHKAPEPAPRPVAAAPKPEPAPAPKLAVASAQHVAAASPERARKGGPSEEDQQKARDAYTRGNTQLFQGHADEAISAFKDALKLDPRNPAAMRALGLAYGQTGNAGQAVQYLKRYLKASPGASDRALVEKRIEQLSAH